MRKNKSSKEVVVKTPDSVLPVADIQDLSAENLIGQAIKNKVSVETMERLLAMRKELKQEYAKEQFDKAMATFQSLCPVIKKDKAGGKTYGGEVAYYYAPLESIVFQVKHLLQDNGFSYAVQTETNDDNVKVSCIVKHTAGHSETSNVSVPLGAGTKVMSAPQIVASALTFAKRYAFCNAFGILTGDDDNDGAVNTLRSAVNVQPRASQPQPQVYQNDEQVIDITPEPEVIEKPQVSDKTKIAHLVKLLKLPEPLAESIKGVTSCEFTEDNYPEIVARLEQIYKDSKEGN